MTNATIKSPGVYINELDGFPNSAVSVATAVPAFIGYTPQAEYQGSSYYNLPTKVSSMAEFQAIFALPDSPPPAAPSQQYSPQYYLVPQPTQAVASDSLTLNGTCYSILPDPGTIYYFYNSIRLFFENGGAVAWIISVGSYGKPCGSPMTDARAQIVNPNVVLAQLQAGLALLEHQSEPTLYICPEATLLTPADNATLMQSMLALASIMQTAVCVFDLIGGRNPDPLLYTNDIQNFRDNTGTIGLDYSTSYYPFVCTTLMQPGEIDYTNLFGGDVQSLAALLNPPGNPDAAAQQILDQIQHPPADPLTTAQYNSALIAASPVYANILEHVLAGANILPASGALAGVYTVNDNANGVWQAPANVSMITVVDVPIHLSADQQANLNVDAVSGKSINALRFFNGQGVLVWGARTLDGNSDNWRYISIRRTMIYLEQSIKLAAQAYVFAANDAQTWAALTSMINSFLNSVWQQGGLQGAKASDAFYVNVGLGSTMTPDDVLNGIMRISVGVAVVRPAEFIVMTFAQQMASSG